MSYSVGTPVGLQGSPGREPCCFRSPHLTAVRDGGFSSIADGRCRDADKMLSIWLTRYPVPAMSLLADPLDAALSSRAKVRLLRLLVSEREPMSAREAARRVGMAKRSADLGLRDLVQAGVVSRLGSGPQPSYVINPHSALVRHAIAPLFRGGPGASDDTGGGEAGAITELFETLRDAAEVPDPKVILWAALFGSTRRGEDDSTSDIDFAIVVTSEKAMETIQRTDGRDAAHLPPEIREGPVTGRHDPPTAAEARSSGPPLDRRLSRGAIRGRCRPGVRGSASWQGLIARAAWVESRRHAIGIRDGCSSPLPRRWHPRGRNGE